MTRRILFIWFLAFNGSLFAANTEDDIKLTKEDVKALSLSAPQFNNYLAQICEKEGNEHYQLACAKLSKMMTCADDEIGCLDKDIDEDRKVNSESYSKTGKIFKVGVGTLALIEGIRLFGKWTGRGQGVDATDKMAAGFIGCFLALSLYCDLQSKDSNNSSWVTTRDQVKKNKDTLNEKRDKLIELIKKNKGER